MSLSTIVTDVSCFGGTNGAINLTVTGGTSPYTYNWGGGVTTEDLTGLSTGTYNVTVTDSNSCTATTSATVNQPASAMSLSTIVTDVSCFGGTNGAINLTVTGGTSPYTYNWGGGVTTEDLTGLSTGTYNVTVTDANGCTATTSATVNQPAVAMSLSTSVTNVSCFGGTNGSINLTVTGGTSPYTYNWGGGVTTEDLTGLSIGTYNVTVTDANSCTATTSATVNQPASAMSLSTIVTDVSCFGGTNGAINLTVTGGTSPYTYNWGGGVTTEDLTGLSTGTYNVTVTDANSCTATTSATVNQPAAAMSLSTIVTDVSCFGGTNGAINLTVTGGTSPYTYNWGGGVTTEDLTGLNTGTYNVTVTDANSCTATTSATVNQPAPAMSLSTIRTDVSLFWRHKRSNQPDSYRRHLTLHV
ncbi:MAG: SprB repeat-containing protein [Sphingobacteriales bacterium]|nr:MAG: SprB repeat-containing protein [Sphingobacteriales bacterium]